MSPLAKVAGILGKVQVECGYRVHRGSGGVPPKMAWKVVAHSGRVLAEEAVRWNYKDHRYGERGYTGSRGERRARSHFRRQTDNRRLAEPRVGDVVRTKYGLIGCLRSYDDLHHTYQVDVNGVLVTSKDVEIP